MSWEQLPPLVKWVTLTAQIIAEHRYQRMATEQEVRAILVVVGKRFTGNRKCGMPTNQQEAFALVNAWTTELAETFVPERMLPLTHDLDGMIDPNSVEREEHVVNGETVAVFTTAEMRVMTRPEPRRITRASNVVKGLSLWLIVAAMRWWNRRRYFASENPNPAPVCALGPVRSKP